MSGSPKSNAEHSDIAAHQHIAQQAQQLALDGLAPRKRKRANHKIHVPADHKPIASVMLDVQATHLGRTFDYLVDQAQDSQALPGVRVRVRFGHQLLDGIIWKRQEHSDTPTASLRFLERVISPVIVADEAMRGDIEAIADAYGGTPANIIRLAIPPRVARVDTWLAERAERTQRHNTQLPFGTRTDHIRQSAEQAWKRIQSQYSGSDQLRNAIQAHATQTVVYQSLPGPRLWAKDLAWVVVQSLLEGRSVAVVLPDVRRLTDMASALAAYGLTPFTCQDEASGIYSGDVVTLYSTMTPEERYRGYIALASGQVSCVIGLRATMYAPLTKRPVYIVVDDDVYQYADGFMPYPQVRHVLALRARRHDGTLIVASHARSAISQWQIEQRQANEVIPYRATLKTHMPWVRWLNPEDATQQADPTAHTRLPHRAVETMYQALKKGPVLIAMPHASTSSVFACSTCHTLAKCHICQGPLQSAQAYAPQCAWCGTPAVHFSCPKCGGMQLQTVRIGSLDTVQELRDVLRNVSIVVSNPDQPRGIVEQIDYNNIVVLASYGAIPRVATPHGYGTYRAVLLIDAWVSLYAQGIDARIDMLQQWMQAASMAASRANEGQVLLIGQADEAMANSLLQWDSSILAQEELQERAAAVFPPVISAATVWGERDAVTQTLHDIGVLDGSWATVHCGDMDWPSVLGPRPIAPEPNERGQLDIAQDRVRAIIRVSHEQRDELALRLRASIAKHAAGRSRTELRFAMDPKDVL